MSTDTALTFDDRAERYLAGLAVAIARRYGGTADDGARIIALLDVLLAQIADDITAGGPAHLPHLGTFETVPAPAGASRTLIYRPADDLAARVDGRAAA